MRSDRSIALGATRAIPFLWFSMVANWLLVLAGRSYSTRLGCVVELFVYLLMGGRRESVATRLLDESADLPCLLSRFDAVLWEMGGCIQLGRAPGESERR